MPFYLNPVRAGLDAVVNMGDGYSIAMRWFQAFPTIKTNKIAYHLYFSTIKENVFAEGIKFISIDEALEANIIDLTPGQEYFFSVRPVEYNPTFFDLTLFPIAHDNLRVYPFSLLREDISATDLVIPLLDLTNFTPTGVIKIGVELIAYSFLDEIDSNLILTTLDQRGVFKSTVSLHTTSGFDGYNIFDPTVFLFVEEESDLFDRVFACQCRFEYPNYPFTIVDGYHQVIKDLLSTDLTAADAANEGFPEYDYSGYHGTDPVLLLNGTCVGSYIGGEQGCIDGYGNVNMVRGLNLQDQNTQRQDVELSVTGRPAVLIKRVQTGITCSCYLASSEYPDDRCPLCNNSKFVIGYQQYFNPKRSDGRILVRPGPTDENTKMYEAGLESEFPLSLWTLTVPTIKTRDIIVLFDQDNNEEFRYEVITVTRNNTILGQQGGQLFKVMRIRKFDPAYQIRIFRDTSNFPTKIFTSIGFVLGIPPHLHSLVRSEKTTSIDQINQMTDVVQGHNHEVVNGIITPVLGHTHKVLF